MRKKDKLYTANRFNQPLFMQKRENLFPDGGNVFGISKADNPFSKGNIAGGIGAMAKTPIGGAMVSAIGSAVGGLTHKAISGGYSSGAGNAIAEFGNTIGGAVGQFNPLLGAAVQAGSGIIGGGINALWGTKVNEQALKENKEGNSKLLGFSSNASSFDAIKGPQSVANVQDAYSGGVFKKGWAEDKNKELWNSREQAALLAQKGIENNVGNLERDQINNELANYAAYGGALDYGLAMDYLNTKRQNTQNKNQITNVFAGTPKGIFALGGDTQTHGADWSSGLMHIDAGSQHELNPNDGVRLGVDNEGIPNLVEENETVYDDYVFSNRIYADDGTLQKFHLPKKAKLTYADISKRLEKEIKERENDPISQAGFRANMHSLMDEQERQKQEMEAQRAKEAFEALSPEEQTAVMQQVAQQEQAAPQQAAMKQQPAMQQPSPEEMAMAEQQQAQEYNLGQQPEQFAKGGHLFPWGGIKEMFAVNPPYAASRTTGFIPYVQDDKNQYYNEDAVLAEEGTDRFKAWTDFVNSYWDNPDLDNESKQQIEDYLKMLDATAGGNNLFDKDGNMTKSAKDYFNHARTKDHKWGYYHLTPTQIDTAQDVTADGNSTITEEELKHRSRVFHALEGDDDYIQGELDPNIGAETRRVKLPNGDTVIYHDKVRTPEEKAAEATGKNLAPKRSWEGWRYTGLFGPAIGLGMQAAGVGRPDTASLDAAVEGAGNYREASYQPLGNYLAYRPLDIWYEQNRLNANARATERSILNSGANQGSKMAGLLASGYNDQMASGSLFRQAQEYNDALRERVATFNRGTDQFNAEQYGATSRFNAGAYNDANRAARQLRLQAAAQKMDADAGWYNSLYGNIGALTKGIADIGVENKRDNMINWMISKGIFGAVDPNDPEMKRRVKVVSAEGGQVKRKKDNKRKGLTF